MSKSRIVETKKVVLLIASIVERESEQMQIFPLPLAILLLHPRWRWLLLRILRSIIEALLVSLSRLL